MPEEQNPPKENEKAKPSRWRGVLIATLVSAIITIAVAWWQVSRSERQAVLADQERAKSIRMELISIVEEHVINDKPIDIGRLARLIELRRREEHVTQRIRVTELFERAEFNILNSPYLEFHKKQTYKTVFDSIYEDLASRTFKPFENQPYADLFNETAKNIQDGKTSEALNQLTRIADSVTKDIRTQQDAKRNTYGFFELFRRLTSSPTWVALFAIVYMTMFLLYWRLRTLRRERRELWIERMKRQARLHRDEDS